MSLLVAEGDQQVAVAVIVPTLVFYQLSFHEGSRYPLERGAAGIALLASMPPAVPDPSNLVIKSEKQSFKIEVVASGIDTLTVTAGGAGSDGSNPAGNFAGVISGLGGVAITGGHQELLGLNTYQGGTLVTNGAILSINSSASLGASTSTLTPPFSVNLMALDKRLSRTWRSRAGSPL